MSLTRHVFPLQNVMLYKKPAQLLARSEKELPWGVVLVLDQAVDMMLRPMFRRGHFEHVGHT